MLQKPEMKKKTKNQYMRSRFGRAIPCAFCLIVRSIELLAHHLRLGLEPIVQVRSVPRTALFEQVVGAHPDDLLG
jgi:hypothetical protein